MSKIPKPAPTTSSLAAAAAAGASASANNGGGSNTFSPTKPSSADTAAAGIQVVVRLRPMNERELQKNTLPVVSASTENRDVTVIRNNASQTLRNVFRYDNVFTAFSDQKEVFDATLGPVIEDVLSGYESTVLAYGQTGTGKT